jgi:hypothetical protein
MRHNQDLTAWSVDNFRFVDLNEAARAADASREANVAVYGEWLK